jgi:hypothetical protein
LWWLVHFSRELGSFCGSSVLEVRRLQAAQALVGLPGGPEDSLVAVGARASSASIRARPQLRTGLYLVRRTSWEVAVLQVLDADPLQRIDAAAI